MAQLVKNPSASVGNTKDTGLIPVLRRCPRGGNGNSFQYSCLENPTERGAWWAIAHGVAKSWTRLRDPTEALSLCSGMRHWL